MGLVAPRHVGSSQTRARTRVPCIGRQSLNHYATREAREGVLDAGNAAGTLKGKPCVMLSQAGCLHRDVWSSASQVSQVNTQ